MHVLAKAKIKLVINKLTLSVHCLCSCIAEKADMFLLRGSGYRLAPDFEIVLLTCH